jgi:hypothetical protein
MVGATVTVAVWLADPPAPVQDNVKLVFVLTLPVACDPLVAMVPLQPPEAAHEVALLELHVSVALAPFATLVGLAASETVGGPTEVVTVTDCTADPPGPEQLRV